MQAPGQDSSGANVHHECVTPFVPRASDHRVVSWRRSLRCRAALTAEIDTADEMATYLLAAVRPPLAEKPHVTGLPRRLGIADGISPTASRHQGTHPFAASRASSSAFSAEFQAVTKNEPKFNEDVFARDQMQQTLPQSR
jgi:hypothetical protein